MIKSTLLIFLCVAISACSSSTVISTSDPEAKIYVNGEFYGQGKAVYSDSKVVGASNIVTIKKEGCQEDNHIFSRNEKFDIGACLGGVLVLVPFLWVMKYKPARSYDYLCKARKD